MRSLPFRLQRSQAVPSKAILGGLLGHRRKPPSLMRALRPFAEPENFSTHAPCCAWSAGFLALSTCGPAILLAKSLMNRQLPICLKVNMKMEVAVLWTVSSLGSRSKRLLGCCLHRVRAASTLHIESFRTELERSGRRPAYTIHYMQKQACWQCQGDERSRVPLNSLIFR